MSEVKLTLPIPPSANNLFANARKGHGRYITAKYAAWKVAAGWALKAQRPGKVAGAYELHITLPKMRKGSDISNRIKALEDLLVAHRVTPDDSEAVHLTIGRDENASSVVVVVKKAA